MARLLIVAGAGLIGLGLLTWAGFPLGRLPGDFMVRRGSFSFYFPLTTSIVLSLAFTLVMMFVKR